jgi:hypothetical protein
MKMLQRLLLASTWPILFRSSLETYFRVCLTLSTNVSVCIDCKHAAVPALQPDLSLSSVP